MTYAVKELFLTLQGEGAQTGRRAVFLRFAGCNLWTGREQDRATAVCTFCDTDFVGTDGDGGGKFADRCRPSPMPPPPAGGRRPIIAWSSAPAVSRCCNSMPALIDALHARGF